MFRAMGFLSGAALVIVAMFVVMGYPEGRSDAPAGDKAEAFASKASEAGTVPPALTRKRLELPEETAGEETVGPPAAARQQVGLPAATASAERIATPVAPLEEIVVSAERLPATEVAEVADAATAERLPDVVVPPGPAPDVLAAAEPFQDTPPPASVEPASPAAVLAEAEVPFDSMTEAAEPAAPAHNSQWQSIWNPFRSQIAANGFAARLSRVTDIDYRVVRLKPGAYQVAFAYTDDNERAAKLAQIQGATGLDLPEAVP